MRKFVINYLWYDEEKGVTRVSNHIVRTLKELSDWMDKQPPVHQVCIINVYELKKNAYNPYTRKEEQS